MFLVDRSGIGRGKNMGRVFVALVCVVRCKIPHFFSQAGVYGIIYFIVSASTPDYSELTGFDLRAAM